MKKTYFIFIIIFLSALLGFFSGRTYERKKQNLIASSVNNQLKKETNQLKADIANLEQEQYALKNDLGILQDVKKEKYANNKFGLSSPLLEDKNVELTTYKYKNATIIHKRINIDSFNSVEIWEYQTPEYYIHNDIPEDFVIFGGYENYLNHARPVNEIQQNWKESYKPKKTERMYYGYEYTPKSVGAVTLSTYYKYLNYRNPKPALIILSNSNIREEMFVRNEQDFLEAKKELNKLADSLEVGHIQN